jgi:hypothetical protein
MTCMRKREEEKEITGSIYFNGLFIRRRRSSTVTLLSNVIVQMASRVEGKKRNERVCIVAGRDPG